MAAASSFSAGGNGSGSGGPERNSPPCALQLVPLLATLAPHEMRELEAATRTAHYAKGSLVFREGDVGDTLPLLLAGRVKVVLEDHHGQELILAVVEAPRVVDCLSCLQGTPRSTSAVAIDDVEVRSLPRDAFLRTLQGHPELFQQILQSAAADLVQAIERVRTVALFDLQDQVLRVLGPFARDLDSTRVVVEPRPSHLTIAQMIGKSRETVSRAIRTLKEAGELEVRGHAFVLSRSALDRVQRRHRPRQTVAGPW